MHRSSENLCNWIVLVCSVSSRQGVSIRPRCLGVPLVHQDTHGSTQPSSQGFFPQKMGGMGKALPSAGRFFFAIVVFPPPFPFSKGQNPGNEIAGN